ncbi:MAG: lipid-A-disaccharide synthase [Phycisphaerales bacterium]
MPSAPPTRTTRSAPTLLFTAFEPSGDDHAAHVIAELKRRHPNLTIYAWGGPRMERAGATIIERTGDDAVMGVPGFQKIIEHGKINRRVDEWLEDNRVTVHVPVDSPAANFPICALTKARGVRVVHLVAPQMWAWGPWRIGKLRRLTDLVLCLLPFEEQWFLSRSVPARFIGHPLFDEPVDLSAVDARLNTLRERLPVVTEGPGVAPCIAMMPGSRPKELKGTLPALLDAFRRITQDFPRARGALAVTRPEIEHQLRRRAERLGGWPAGLSVVAGDTDAVVRWCDFAIVKSGTVTLHVARQTKPMVTFYRPDKLVYYLVGKWIVSTPLFTLPNLIAGKRVVPELIPHFGDGQALAVGIYRMMRQPGFADDMRRELARICARFDGHRAAHNAADAIEEVLGMRPPAPPLAQPATAILAQSSSAATTGPAPTIN